MRAASNLIRDKQAAKRIQGKKPSKKSQRRWVHLEDSLVGDSQLSSRLSWTLVTLVSQDDPFTNEFDDISPGRLLRQVAQLYAGSLALPAFSLSVGPRCRPVFGRHCSEYIVCYQELMAKQGAPLNSCNHSQTVHSCFVAITRTFEAGQLIRG